MPAGRNPTLVGTAIFVFGSAGPRPAMHCRGADGGAVLRARLQGLRHGGVSGAGLRWRCT